MAFFFAIVLCIKQEEFAYSTNGSDICIECVIEVGNNPKLINNITNEKIQGRNR